MDWAGKSNRQIKILHRFHKLITDLQEAKDASIKISDNWGNRNEAAIRHHKPQLLYRERLHGLLIFASYVR